MPFVQAVYTVILVCLFTALPAAAERQKIQSHPAAIALLQSVRRHREVLHKDFPGCRSGLLAGMKDEVHHGPMLFKLLVHQQRKKGGGR